jgi:hypothetical protein
MISNRIKKLIKDHLKNYFNAKHWNIENFIAMAKKETSMQPYKKDKK